jgi:hypothetical protein
MARRERGQVTIAGESPTESPQPSRIRTITFRLEILTQKIRLRPRFLC